MRLTLNRRSAIIMTMIQKIKQIPFTVIISTIFVLFVLVASALANPAAALSALFLIAFAVAVLHLASYIMERFF